MTHPWPDGGDRELDDPNRPEDDDEPEIEDPQPCIVCGELRVRGLYEVCRECAAWHLPAASS